MGRGFASLARACALRPGLNVGQVSGGQFKGDETGGIAAKFRPGDRSARDGSKVIIITTELVEIGFEIAKLIVIGGEMALGGCGGSLAPVIINSGINARGIPGV